MKKTILLISLFVLLVKVNAQNSFPVNDNVVIKQQTAGVFRAYDVVNFNNFTVSRQEATTDASGQFWLKDANGNYKVMIRSNNMPSSIAGELVIGQYALASTGNKLYVNGASEFNGIITGNDNITIKQVPGSFRSYDVINSNNHVVSRVEATLDASGQFWLKDADGNYKVAIKSNNSPSSIAGELIVGKYTTISTGKKLYINGDSQITGSMGIGTNDTKGYNLAVAGKAVAEEIKVMIQSSWPDFVFESEYKLPSLLEVEKHIKKTGHLMNIPSAKEVEENGIFLGEMNSKFLQKIEELTLYAIEQEKKIIALEEALVEIKLQNKKLIEVQKRLEKLEDQ
tara:strand:+ start:801 stop:1820 length:1020 start_codon:yes stop_codon:yes gene_type:complete